ncbi:hypothetical protein Leryth_021026 [Lithospermum erythrorhizon]|nr:hypothetical protein Leryth_021026 [Lithospermum erythrorhizon]
MAAIYSLYIINKSGGCRNIGIFFILLYIGEIKFLAHILRATSQFMFVYRDAISRLHEPLWFDIDRNIHSYA